MQILHDTRGVRTPRGGLRLLLLQLARMPRARIALDLLQALLQLLGACAGSAHQGARLGQLLRSAGGALFRRSERAHPLLLTPRLLRTGRPTLGKLCAQLGGVLLELSNTLLEARAALLGMACALLGMGRTLLGRGGPLRRRRLRRKRFITRLLELEQALGMARETLLRLLQRGGARAQLGLLIEPLFGARRCGTQRSPCRGRERPVVGRRLLLVCSLPRQSLGRDGGAGAGAGGRCASRVQHRQLGGTVGIGVTTCWRRDRRQRT